MAQTTQTPKNPHVSRPTTAIGIDVQPEQRISPKPMSKKLPTKGGKQSKKLPIKGGKQPRKHLSQKLLR